ncbi:elongation factor P [Histidinibacterium aquaticum]|uniref:Elongation factor P n=1 Tax=Histidinibacterium aquaticum TaxID=2613962 RepID=A0A5J5GES6_9RHOB|nr:elongation factor P [Histidinibacterium aquaticum]KAA9006675.1 elongation factor P [Histidinibacterium aquaticum]
MAKVIASQLRKGNVVDINEQLYVILSAQNVSPGKGTPVTQVDMRRISDGTKVSDRWKTTDSVERAHVEEKQFDFLYDDAEGFHFMDPETFEQVAVDPDVVGDSKVWLRDGMRCYLSIHNEIAIAMQLPQKVTVEIVDTEPVVKGQTASSSYKPAEADNGVRVMVPPHITTGTRVVVNTEDATYVERAKD